MKYSLAAALISENVSRETIRTLADYGYTDEPVESVLEAIAAWGTHQDCVDYLEELAEDCFLAEAPEVAKQYFDYAAWVRDLQLSGDYSIIEFNGHHVLINNHA
jgi:antirestriction protein